MKGIILYFSGTGNTELAVQRIVNKVSSIKFEYYDMRVSDPASIDSYDVVGFATFTQLFSAPEYVKSFMEKVKLSKGKYAFLLNTYGLMSGNTLSDMAKIIKKRGYNIIGGHSFHTPESSPTMIKFQIKSENAPSSNELMRFDDFISELDVGLENYRRKPEIKYNDEKVYKFIERVVSKTSFIDIGVKTVCPRTCTKCGTCASLCPYEAINFNGDIPEFLESRCRSCFICYNRCPKDAITSAKHQSIRYTRPHEKYKTKMVVLSRRDR